MKSTISESQADWRLWLGLGSKFLLHWGWFVLLSMILVTLLSIRLSDTPSTASYDATLNIQLQLPAGTNSKAAADTTGVFFQNLLMSPDTLSLALPKLTALKQFQGFQLADLEGSIFASAVTGTNSVQLSANADTSGDAVVLVTVVYQALEDKLHNQRMPMIQGLTASLNTELLKLQMDQANTMSEIQTLTTEGKGYTYQARLLGNLQSEEQRLIKSISDLSIMLNQHDATTGDLLTLANTTPTITTFPAIPSTQGLRIALAPLTGLIMGIGGALLASGFSNRLPLRGKKRAQVLPHIATVIPTLPGLQQSPLQALMLRASLFVPLLRLLRYQSNEHEKPLRFITVTSPAGQEGKSTIATCLAIASAQSGLRTLLVDANRQRPVLDRWFEQPDTGGLLESIRCLANGTTGPSPLQSTAINKLLLLPIGKSTTGQGDNQLEEPLQLNGLSPLMHLLASEAELVIFDGPSLLSGGDAANLVTLSDIVLVVVNARTSKSGAVLEAETLLKTMGIAFGIVLNRARRELVE